MESYYNKGVIIIKIMNDNINDIVNEMIWFSYNDDEYMDKEMLSDEEIESIDGVVREWVKRK